MKKIFISLALISGLSAQAEWVTTFDVDTQYEPTYSKRLTSDIVSVWHKTSFTKQGSNNYFVSLAHYNCKEKTYKPISYTSYTNGKVDILNSFKYDKQFFEDVEPDTYNSKKMIHACQYVR